MEHSFAPQVTPAVVAQLRCGGQINKNNQGTGVERSGLSRFERGRAGFDERARTGPARGWARRARWLAAALAAGYLASGAAQELRTAAQENSVPKFVQQSAGVAGFCVDVMRAVERDDPALKFVGDQTWLPPKRLTAMLAHDLLDVACGITQSAALEGKFHYLTPALFKVDYKLAARVDDPAPIRNWDDIRQLGNQGIVLGVTGMSILQRVREQNHLIVISSDVTTLTTNLQMLVAGRGRFFFYRSPGLRQAIDDAGLSRQVKILPAVMDSAELYMVTANNLAPETANRLQRDLMRLKQTGELDRILARWQD